MIDNIRFVGVINSQMSRANPETVANVSVSCGL